jgi:hypothetical protein
VRQPWRRFAAGTLLAIGLASLTAVPAAAKDTYPFFGPLEISIVGANGDLRDFIALSAEDRRGANLLVEQLTTAMRGGTQAIQSAAVALPHYQIGVSHLGMTYVTTPWARMTETSFSYYPGAEGTTYLLVRFSQGNAAPEERWLIPLPAVAAMIDQHARGLAAIGTEPATADGSPATWGIAVGAALLAGLSLMLIQDRRRWRRGGAGRSAGKGTDRRS